MAIETRTVGLDLRFTGLCLFVPSDNEKKVYVLMPRTADVACPHPLGHVHPHRTVLVFENTFATGTCAEECEGSYCVEDITDRRLVISNGSPATVAIPDVYQLDRPGRPRKARRRFDRECQAAILLMSGHCERVPAGARFRIDGDKAPMPNEVIWTVDDVVPILVLESLIGAPPRTLRLVPGTDGRITIYVRNVPPEEVCPAKFAGAPPSKGDVIHHFFAFDQLLADHHQTIDEPVWEDDPGDRPPSLLTVGGNPYTCMPAQTPPGDDEG